MIHKNVAGTFVSNSVKSKPISIIFAVSKPEKCTKQGMHLLIYYEDVDQLGERLISVWCELDQSV